MDNRVRFSYGSSSWYQNLTEKDPDKLYFISNTKRIYRGEELFSDANAITLTNDINSVSLEYVDNRVPGSPVIREAYEPGSLFIESKNDVVTIYALKSDGTFETVVSSNSSSSISPDEIDALKKLSKYTVVGSSYINEHGFDSDRHIPNLEALGDCLTWK